MRLAISQRDSAETVSQMLRLLLAVPGDIVGGLPIRASVRAGVSALHSIPVIKDLERFVQ